MDLALLLTQVEKTYLLGFGRKKAALQPISLEVAAGEAFGFVGANGAGKSTTIKILMGLLKPTFGTAQIFGVDVGVPTARRGVGYVPESPIIPDHLTPYEVLQLGCVLHDVKKADLKAHCLNWLERFGLAEVAGQPLRKFSKGMQQRTALAHALAIEPRLLILDEPMSGLDPAGRKLVLEVLDEYKKTGGTLFFSSHVLYDVERLADRYGLIEGGRLVRVDYLRNILEEENAFLITYLGTRLDEAHRAFGGGRWQATVGNAQLWDFMRQMQEAGNRLVELKPSRSLDEWFWTGSDSVE